MAQPTETPLYFRPALPNYAPAGMTIINPVSVVRSCPPLEWNPTLTNTQTSQLTLGLSYHSETPIGATLLAQSCDQNGQSPNRLWQAYKSMTTSNEQQINLNNNSAASVLPSSHNDLSQTEFTTIESPQVISAASCSKASNLRSCNTKQHESKKDKKEKINTEFLQETIYRQRELIGKLITVIVKDRLKRQDKSVDYNLKDSEVSEIEKLLNLTNSLNNNKLSFSSDKTATIGFSSSKRKRKTRTVTGEKKHLCKRLRKERKSPKLSLYSCQPSVSPNSNSVVATVSQTKSPDGISSEIKESPEVCYGEEDPTEDIVSATTTRVLDLMHPDGDSRLFSLRVEFARQLKSLEEDFQKEYESTLLEEEPCEQQNISPCDEVKVEEQIDDEEVSGDSDWLPSSVASSTTIRRSTSLSSDSSRDSFCMVKKKFPKRKHVRCYKPKRHNKKRTLHGKANNSSCSKSITPRRASGMALQKIDRMLRHPESDDFASNPAYARNFHERALHKIRQTMALWNRMSLEMSSFLLSDRNETILDENREYCQLIEPINHDENDDVTSSSRLSESNNENIVCITQKFEEEEAEENLAALPNNKTDPTFMLSKFLQLLPEHDELMNYVTDSDGIALQHTCHDEEEKDTQIRGCEINEGRDSSCPQGDGKSSSDIFHSQNGGRHDDVEKESTNHSAPFLCQFDYSETNDPDIIGEVIVVTTDENRSPTDAHETLEDKVGESTVKEIKKEDLLPATADELFDDGNDVLHHQSLFEDLPAPTIASTPSSVIRMNNFEVKTDSDSDDEELPKFQLSCPKTEVGLNRPLVQMFRPLNPESKDSELRKLISPSQIVVTNVVSLHSESTITNEFERRNGDDNPPDVGDPKSDSQISETRVEFYEKRENANKSFCQTNASGENDKCLARPLKKLISTIKLSGTASNDENVVEWGLIPRRAMHVAKQRIQEQLCGGESKNEEGSKTSRRLTLRSHSVSGGGDCTDEDTKKVEKKNEPTKKLIPTDSTPTKSEFLITDSHKEKPFDSHKEKTNLTNPFASEKDLICSRIDSNSDIEI